MSKFRKKPVVIEAFQMTRDRRADNSDWPEWMHRAWNEGRDVSGSLQPVVHGTSDGYLEIATLEGFMQIDWDDWIIQGVNGEIYPCKDDIFQKTYEAVL